MAGQCESLDGAGVGGAVWQAPARAAGGGAGASVRPLLRQGDDQVVGGLCSCSNRKLASLRRGPGAPKVGPASFHAQPHTFRRAAKFDVDVRFCLPSLAMAWAASEGPLGGGRAWAALPRAPPPKRGVGPATCTLRKLRPGSAPTPPRLPPRGPAAPCPLIRCLQVAGTHGTGGRRGIHPQSTQLDWPPPARVPQQLLRTQPVFCRLRAR